MSLEQILALIILTAMFGATHALFRLLSTETKNQKFPPHKDPPEEDE